MSVPLAVAHFNNSIVVFKALLLYFTDFALEAKEYSSKSNHLIPIPIQLL